MNLIGWARLPPHNGGTNRYRIGPMHRSGRCPPGIGDAVLCLVVKKIAQPGRSNPLVEYSEMSVTLARTMDKKELPAKEINQIPEPRSR